MVSYPVRQPESPSLEQLKEQLITLRLKGGGETVFVGEFDVAEGG